MDDERNDYSERALAGCSDEELVARLRRARVEGRGEGVQAAFAMLHFRHRRRVQWLVAAKVPAERVEELEQDVFLAVFEGVAGDRPIKSFQAWLTRLTRNTVAELWRGREGTQIKLDREAAARLTDDPDGPPRPEPSADGGHGEWEAWQVVDDLLARLSGQHRAIVEHYVIDDCSAQEAARRTGATPANVYQVAHRFRLDLRRLLDGGRPDDNDDPGSAGRTGPTQR